MNNAEGVSASEMGSDSRAVALYMNDKVTIYQQRNGENYANNADTRDEWDHSIWEMGTDQWFDDDFNYFETNAGADDDDEIDRQCPYLWFSAMNGVLLNIGHLCHDGVTVFECIYSTTFWTNVLQGMAVGGTIFISIWFINLILGLRGWSRHDPTRAVPKKPPDPKHAADDKREATKMNEVRHVMALQKMIKIEKSLPTCVLRSERPLREEINGFMADDGTLQTEKMPLSLLSRLRTRLRDLPLALLGISDQHTAVIDSGASKIGLNDKRFFVKGTLKLYGVPREMKGIAGGLKILGEGTCHLDFIARNGQIVRVKRFALYIPDLPVILVPPQALFPVDSKGYFKIGGGTASLVFESGLIVDCEIDPRHGLPLVRVFENANESAKSTANGLYSCVTEEKNQNLSRRQKNVLRWHHRLGHLGMATVLWLGATGILGASGELFRGMDKGPMCGTCAYAKQVRRSANATLQVPTRALGSLSDNILLPGQETAVDQFEVMKKGRLIHTAGREDPSHKFCGGTIFADVATGRTKVYPQISLNATETVKSKIKYEREAKELGVMVLSYRADNGVFTSELFQAELERDSRVQKITYCGVSAHHQNGIAERSIRTTITRSRVQLLHSMLRWPDTTTSDLWPMSMWHGAYLINNIPTRERVLSPEELFTRTASDHSQLQDLPVWGCPVYVLEPTLRDGRTLPKWQPRSRRGQYMGKSPLHASNVALVRNLTTGRISPQYHVVFDPMFETIHADSDTPPEQWEILLETSRFQNHLDDIDAENLSLHDEWLVPSEIAEARKKIRDREHHRRKPIEHPSQVKVPTDPDHSTTSTDDVVPGENAPSPTRAPSTEGSALPTSTTTSSKRHDYATDTSLPTPHTATTPVFDDIIEDNLPTLRRSSRSNAGKRAKMYGYDEYDGVTSYLTMVRDVTDCIYLPTTAALPRASRHFSPAYMAMLGFSPDSGLLDDDLDPHLFEICFKAKKGGDPDTPNYGEAMRSEYRREFRAAMIKEVQDLAKHGTWRAVLRSSLPSKTHILPSIWSFKIKRMPNGQIQKFKARLCARGDMQIEGVDVFETHSPTVRWSTVRCVLTYALQLGLNTRQCDVSQAFIQAKLPEGEPIFLEPPKDFYTNDGADIVLKLDRSLYGLQQASFLFFEKLRDELTGSKLGFTQSKNDPCLFYNNGLIVLVYIDDLLIFHRDKKRIDSFIHDLGKLLPLTQEQISSKGVLDVYQYLGIEVSIEHYPKDGSAKSGMPKKIVLKQERLTGKILAETNMIACNGISTPASEGAIGSDEKGARFNETWSYPRVVGMLMYLVNTRPDIQFAVHQCARFTHAPRASHAAAVKRICRYLKETTGNGLGGLEFDASLGNELVLDCYVDSDFCGLHGVEDQNNPASAKSRTGFVFFLGKCPVHWVSKLQGLTTLSSTASEYVALSDAMRVLLPMRELVKELTTTLGLEMKTTTVRTKVHEDNMSTISMANAPYMSSRTRHINQHFHFFKEHVGRDKGIVIQYIGTLQQIADMLTKGLVERLFKPLRKQLMGW